MPDTDFDHLEESVRAVKSIGCKVSVDSANADELIRGSKAGADYVLSINQKNLKIMDEIQSIPILIPDTPGDLKSLEKLVKLMIKKKIFMLILFLIQFIMVLQIRLRGL